MSRKLFTFQEDDLCFGTADALGLKNNSHRIKDMIGHYKNPLWLYRRDIITERIAWIQSWAGLGRLHYAMKANFNREILEVFKNNNCGIDAVSLGEMRRAIEVGFKPSDIILSGVGKTEDELTWAVQNQIYQINIESLSEIKKITKICQRLNKKASLAIRVNPEVDAQTHPGIATALKDSKFGLDFKAAFEAVNLISIEKNLELKAISFHIGSQIKNVQVFEKAIQAVKPFYLQAQSLCPELDRLDLGGGLGINYEIADSDEDFSRWKQLEKIYTEQLRDFKAFCILEIGRFLVARSGLLISRVEVIKNNSEKQFLILDAGMSLLLRPALYQAQHEIYPLKLKAGALADYTVVGPICESSDILAVNKKLSFIEEGDLVAICDAGAYGSSMSSHYNLREPAVEIVI